MFGFGVVVERFSCSLHEAQAAPSHVETVALPTRWSPPGTGIIKINVDVAIPENADFIRIAMVARDARGVTIWWARKEIVGRPHPSEGEAMAVVLGVHQALDKGWSRVIIETDSLPVFRYLNEGASSLVSFGAILDECFIARSKLSTLDCDRYKTSLFRGCFLPLFFNGIKP